MSCVSPSFLIADELRLAPFLSAFLGEAFGAPTPHPADHARNNPFAEGGHDAGDEDDVEPGPSLGHHPHDPFAARAAGATPLNYLFSLLNAFSVNPPLAGNPGDYAFGEASFQNLLNDLMAQVGGHSL